MSIVSPTLGRALSCEPENVTFLPLDMTVKVLPDWLMTLPVIGGLSTRPCCVKTLAALAGGAGVGVTSPCFFAAGAGVGFFSAAETGNVVNAVSTTKKIVRMTAPFVLPNQTSLSHLDHSFIHVTLPLPAKEFKMRVRLAEGAVAPSRCCRSESVRQRSLAKGEQRAPVEA